MNEASEVSVGEDVKEGERLVKKRNEMRGRN